MAKLSYDEIRNRNSELEVLFELQWKRIVEADALYVAAHPRPDCPHGYKPDLGTLIGWLMKRASDAKVEVERLRAELLLQTEECNRLRRERDLSVERD